jgi:hypothetical protein
MPRKRIGTPTALAGTRGGLAEKLAAELKSGRDYGQPTIYEQEYSTGKLRVTVIWDEWARIPPEERSAIILRAYELAEGAEYRDRIALASGLTVPEAQAAGMLPFQIIPALRKGDPVTAEQVREAMLAEGASELANPQELQLRFATQEEAEAGRQRLINRLPGSDPIWVINQELAAQDYLNFTDSFHGEAG